MFTDARILADNEQPSGPSFGTPSATATFRVTIDPANPPDPGPAAFEIRNAFREQRARSQVEVVSRAKPILRVVDPQVIGPGSATITLKGGNFDPNPVLSVTGVYPASSRVLDWEVTRESQGVLKASGRVDAGLRAIRFMVANPNQEKSDTLSATVSNTVRSLTVQELANKGGAIYPTEETTLTLDLASDAGFSGPRQGDRNTYEVQIDTFRLTPIIVGEGKLQVALKYPSHTNVRSAATEISRPIRVLRNGQLAWQADQGLVVQLPVIITDSATIQAPPLLPGAEKQIVIRGKHFRDKDIDVVPGAGLEVKQGTKEVTASTLRFSVVTSGTSLPTGPVAVTVHQDGRSYPAGTLKVTPMPDINVIASVKAKGISMAGGKTNKVDSDGQVFVEFQGDRLRGVGDMIYVVRAVRDTVGEPIIRAPFEVLVPEGETVARPVVNVRDAGLQPGQKLRIDVSQKSQPERLLSPIARVERTGAAHVGLLLGAAAARLELGSNNRTGKRHATLSDVHLGVEYIVSNYSSDFGLGAGVTLLGAPKAATSPATIGLALTPTIRFRALTLMIGKQLTADPAAQLADEEATPEGPQRLTTRPFYLMLGLSLGTDISSVAKALGGG